MKTLCFIFALTSCYTARYPVTPSVAESSTYEIQNELILGTAWAVDPHHVITAGHICEDMGPDYTLTSISRRNTRATSVAWEKSEDGRFDLCLLRTPLELPLPLVIADQMPRVGDSVGFVGYPDGILTRSTGSFLGDTDGPDSHYDDADFTAPCDHGASGSALYTERGVWGVLVRLRIADGKGVDPSLGCTAIPLDRLKSFLDDYNVDYDTTPDPIPEYTPPSGLG